MIQTLMTIAAASLLGSMHCVAMCGPLVALSHRGWNTPHHWSAATYAAMWHSAGRLLTYAGLGVAAGAVGKAVDLAGHVGNVQRSAAIISGLMLIAWGIATVIPFTPRRDAASAGLFGRSLVQLRGRKPSTRAATLGMLTGLLPCGWLWAFVATAAGTASLWGGASIMIAFWLGTLPAMIGMMSLGAGVLHRLRAKRPVLIAMILVAMGVTTLWMRWHDAGSSGITNPTCHSPRVAK